MILGQNKHDTNLSILRDIKRIISRPFLQITGFENGYPG
jgi:hypothetical protein